MKANLNPYEWQNNLEDIEIEYYYVEKIEE